MSLAWAAKDGVGNTPDVAPVGIWTTGYGSLVNVVFADGPGEVRFTLEAPGALLTLLSLDVAGWPNTDRTSSVRVYDLAYNILFDTGSIVFPGQGFSTIGLGQASTAGLIVQWGPDDGQSLGGIDNLSFSIASGDPGVIPEPATWAMLVAGFGLVGGALRRRSRALSRNAMIA